MADRFMISAKNEYERAQGELRHLEDWLARLQPASGPYQRAYESRHPQDDRSVARRTGSLRGRPGSEVGEVAGAESEMSTDVLFFWKNQNVAFVLPLRASYGPQTRF
jgi:hypothetical protein